MLRQRASVDHSARAIGNRQQLHRPDLAMLAGDRWFEQLGNGLPLLHQPAPSQIKVHQHLHVLELQLAVGGCPTVVSNPLKLAGQGVLQEAADELRAADGARFADLGCLQR